MKAARIIRNVVAIVAGYAVLEVAFPVLILLMQILASIPVIGSFLFYPVETSWAALVTINVMSVGAGAVVASFVQPKEKAWGMRAYGILVFVVCVISFILAIMSGDSIWPSVLAGGTGLLVAFGL